MTVSAWLTPSPNWSEPVRISHVWRTGIIPLLTGGEQRSKLFTWSRLRQTFTLDLLVAPEVRYWRALVHQHRHEIWGVPVWPDVTDLTAAAGAEQPVVAVRNASDRHFTAGGALVLIDPDDPANYEAGEIASIDGNEITLADDLEAAWPAGTLCLPAFAARIAEAEESSAAASLISLSVEATEVYE